MRPGVKFVSHVCPFCGLSCAFDSKADRWSGPTGSKPVEVHGYPETVQYAHEECSRARKRRGR